MNAKQTAAYEAIFKALIDLPESELAEVIECVGSNGIFCCACGYGSYEKPNPNCQCENDE